MATISAFSADAKGRPSSAAEIVTAAGTRIYLLPVETFFGHVNNLYLVDHPEHPLLFDAASGDQAARGQLAARFEEIGERFGVRTRLEGLAELVLSHAHIDHFGGAHAFAERGTPISIHELDARAIEGFRERFLLATRDFRHYLLQTGLDRGEVEGLITLYRENKDLFPDLEPDRRLLNGDRVGPGWRVLHVPGHCPGMICLAVDDVLLTADHLLARITPVQRPQSITPFMGLENYFRSLEKLLAWGDFALGLGGHEAPIPRITERVAETLAHHERRLRQVFETCHGLPSTVSEISRHLFGAQQGYGAMLALSEAGAHVEYLHELGYLTIENLDEVIRDDEVAPRYQGRERAPHPLLARTSLPVERASVKASTARRPSRGAAPEAREWPRPGHG